MKTREKRLELGEKGARTAIRDARGQARFLLDSAGDIALAGEGDGSVMHRRRKDSEQRPQIQEDSKAGVRVHRQLGAIARVLSRGNQKVRERLNEEMRSVSY